MRPTPRVAQVQQTGQRLVTMIVTASLLVAACGGGVAAPASEADIGLGLDTLPATDEAAANPVPTSTSVPASTTVAPSTTAAPDPHLTWIATAHDDVEHLDVHDAPGGQKISLPFLVPNPHQFGGPLTVMVTDGEPGDAWVKVQIPLRPNGREGWIRTEDYDLTSTRVWAEVVLSESRVTVYDGDTVLVDSGAVIGAEESPTPLGTFYVAAKRRNPESEAWLGPWALVLSSYSEAFETFSGGLPVIAVHGTNRPDQLGEAITNGCVRVPNDVIAVLAQHVPLGAPVTVLS